jgi:hypothetical protein
MPVRLYTEPDIRWWMENRKVDYYSMNAVDAAALILQLQLLGNRQAQPHHHPRTRCASEWTAAPTFVVHR